MKKILLVFMCLGCASTSNLVMLSGNQSFGAINEKEVSVFLQESDLPKEHEKIALIEFKNNSDNENLYHDVIIQAAEIGANGIYPSKKESSGKISVNFYSIIRGFDINKTKDIEFVAIRYKKDGKYPDPIKKRTKDDMYN